MATVGSSSTAVAAGNRLFFCPLSWFRGCNSPQFCISYLLAQTGGILYLVFQPDMAIGSREHGSHLSAAPIPPFAPSSGKLENFVTLESMATNINQLILHACRLWMTADTDYCVQSVEGRASVGGMEIVIGAVKGVDWEGDMSSGSDIYQILISFPASVSLVWIHSDSNRGTEVS